MRCDWTPAALRALEQARELAIVDETGSGAAHVLSSLICETEGRAALLLASAGLGLDAVRNVLEKHKSTSVETVTVTTVECMAHDLARAYATDRTVGSELLLLAALRTDARLEQALAGAGLVVTALETSMSIGQIAVLPLDDTLDLSPPREALDVSRILDVNLNRAREALRVIEDYCRFVLADAFLSREWKTLRHNLAEIIANSGIAPLWLGRDTRNDVGTTISTPSEAKRGTLFDVVQANAKRLQEALRSLEEHGKVLQPALGSAFERLRYQTYTLERAVLVSTTVRDRLQGALLYAIIGAAQCSTALDFVIAEAAAGGTNIFQLREKNLSDRELLQRAYKVRRWTRAAGALFIVNDRPDIARLVDADGVHLGQEDLPVADARRILGSDALVGVSTHNLDQVRQAVLDGANYIGIGPVFPSSTKTFDTLAGLDFVRSATAETALPGFALGGIRCDNVDAALAAGATRIAVSSEICHADEPRAVAQKLQSALRNHS